MSLTRIKALLFKNWPVVALIALSVLSKFVGFLKNAFIAYYFGASQSSDLLGILMFPTDFVTSYLMNQTIITAITIFFAKHIESGERQEIFLRTYRFYQIFLSIGSAVLAVVMKLQYPEVPFLWCVLSALPGILYGMAGIMQSYLNYNREFLLPGIQELITSILLTFGVAAAAMWGVWAYPVVMIGTGIVRVLIQLPGMKTFLKNSGGVQSLFSIFPIRFEKELLMYVGPIIVTFIMSGVPGFAMLSILSKSGEGYIAAYNYANKIIGLFNPIVVIPLTTYLIPMMQRWSQEGKNVAKISLYTLTMIGILAVLFALILACWPEVLVRLIYARGSFDVAALALTSQFLKYQAFALVGYALMYYLLQVSLLKDQSKRLILSYIVGTIIILVLLYTLPFAAYITIGTALTVGVMASTVILAW